MKSKISNKVIIFVIVAIIIGVISFTVAAPFFSNPDTYAKTIESLDDKRDNVLALTTSSAAMSTGLTMIPGDVAEPIANKMADLTSTLMIVLCAIFLEKYMLTLAGMLTFKLFIPAACILLIIYVFTNRDIFKKIAVKLILLGLCFVFLVPVSTTVTNFIENIHETSLEQSIEDAERVSEALNENANSSESIISKWFYKISGGVSGTLEKAERILSDFVEATALLIITSCVIPLLTLWLFIWIIKMVLGINIPTKGLKSIALGGSKIKNDALIEKKTGTEN